MKYVIALFLITLLSFHFSSAQDSLSTDEDSEATEALEDGYLHQAIAPRDLKATKEYESADIKVRKFDDDQWKKVIGSTDYDETQGKKKKNTNGEGSADEKRGKRYKGNDHDDDEEDDADGGFSFNIGPLGGLLIKVIFYGLVIAIIGIILYQIIKNTSLKPKVRNADAGASDLASHVEDISDLNIDDMLAKALASGNFRLTIRIYFLGLLKKLNESGFIAWKKDKTNRDYLMELYSNPEYFSEVRKLTAAYEQVWYGDHSLSSGLFQELSDEFKAIDQKLNTAKNN